MRADDVKRLAALESRRAPVAARVYRVILNCAGESVEIIDRQTGLTVCRHEGEAAAAFEARAGLTDAN